MSDNQMTKRRGRPKGTPNAKPHLEDAAAYRKRAETAQILVQPGPTRTTISEAVYWPEGAFGGDYGCASHYPSVEAAIEASRATLKLGYGRDRDYNRVHIIETTTRVIEVRLADAE